jgi:hypothetical protein
MTGLGPEVPNWVHRGPKGWLGDETLIMYITDVRGTSCETLLTNNISYTVPHTSLPLGALLAKPVKFWTKMTHTVILI